MANVFAALTVPSANGSGAAVDVSSMGAPKTVVLTGSIRATVNIEVSVSGSSGPWATVATFPRSHSGVGDAPPREVNLTVAAQFMRATVTGYVSGSGICGVGADDRGAQFLNLPATSGNGSGSSVDVSELGTLGTIVVGGNWAGAINIEISQDGTNWIPALSFTSNGAKTIFLVAQYMRVTRSGTAGLAAGTPTVNIGAVNDSAQSGWKLISETIKSAADGPYTSFDLDGTFDGDADGEYKLEIELLLTTGSTTDIVLNVLSPSTDLSPSRLTIGTGASGTAVTTRPDNSDWVLASGITTSRDMLRYTAFIQASRDKWTYRTIRGGGHEASPNVLSLNSFDITGFLTTAYGNATGFNIQSTASNRITSAIVRAYKRSLS